jgi:outer membrane protein assembly factor BamB
MLKRLIPLVALGLAALPARAATPDCDWPMFGHDAQHSFAQASGCSPIEASNAATMVPKWFVHAPDSVTAPPSVVDGIVYVGGWDGTFLALDADDGTELWRYEIDDTHEVAFGRIVGGAWVGTIAVKSGNTVEQKDVVLFGGGATLYALNPGADGGQLIAKIDLDPRTEADKAAQAEDPPQVEIESSPVVGRFGTEGDRIFVGMDVHNRANVGRTGLVALELHHNTGGYFFAFKYKFDPESGIARTSRTEGSGTGWGCGGVWSSPVVDEDALGPGDGVVAFGTASCSRPAESDAGERMFGIAAKDGRLLWSFKPSRPAGFDADQDFGASPNLLPDGVVGEGAKDGWYYTRDLVTGAEKWSRHIAQAGQLNEGFAVGGFLGSAAIGEVNGEPALFAAHALPTPINQTSDGPDLSALERPGQLFALHAFSVATGEPLWDNPLSLPSYGAVTYTNGVVFVPDTFGLQLQIVDANTGALLGIRPTPGAPASAPAIVGDSVYFGIGTRETDAEFKAFGNEIGDFFEQTIGEHPLSPLSGIAAYELPN